MEIYDQLGFDCQFTQALDKNGREFLLLVVKGSYNFPDAPETVPIKADAQTPLVYADEATGEPGFSATKWETDFAHEKPKCDIVLHGAAHAPDQNPVERIRVGLRVGTWTKSFDVFGDRFWVFDGVKFMPSIPSKFLCQTLSYDVAFGGVDDLNKDADRHPSFPANPVGTGWASRANSRLVSGLKLPNTQAVNENVTSPFANYTPMSFGPMGRGWPGRIEYGGTYDQAWIDTVFPFLPKDFDNRYYQVAPPDQQISAFNNGDVVVLSNLTPKGNERFYLPETHLPITLFKGRDIVFDDNVKPDTLIFDPENRKFAFVWRISLPIKRIITEFTEAWIGPPTDAMLRARNEGRQYIRAVSTTPTEDTLE